MHCGSSKGNGGGLDPSKWFVGVLGLRDKGWKLYRIPVEWTEGPVIPKPKKL
jgi:hypothetical protein